VPEGARLTRPMHPRQCFAHQKLVANILTPY
jgi:hypothetical protein